MTYLGKLVILLGLALGLAIALPNSTEATAFNEVRQLIASDIAAYDGFGDSVAVSGDTVVVGAWAENSGGSTSGAAYVFERGADDTGNWDEVKKLTASDAQPADDFGQSVAISDDTIVVGALEEDARADNAGAAYVFQRAEGGTDNWGEVAKLTASDAQADDRFGSSLAVSDDIIVVGASEEDAGGPEAGAAYIFQRDQGGADGWGEVAKLTAPNAQAGDRFGFTVAVSNGTVVVGAHRNADVGSAYVFERHQGGKDNWGAVAQLTASDAQADDGFGISVAIDGDLAVAGASGEDTRGANAGAAYVFQRHPGGVGGWNEAAKLTASDADDFDIFGASVAISRDTIVAGAQRQDAGISDTGAAYAFQRNQGGTDNWGEVKKLTASDAQTSDFFGDSVALSGDIAVVGAFWSDAGGTDSGAAYVFELGSKLIGDANCDSTVNAVDAALVLQFNAALLGTVPCDANADANEDGATNALDATLILQAVAGLLDDLPP